MRALTQTHKSDQNFKVTAGTRRRLQHSGICCVPPTQPHPSIKEGTEKENQESWIHNTARCHGLLKGQGGEGLGDNSAQIWAFPMLSDGYFLLTETFPSKEKKNGS